MEDPGEHRGRFSVSGIGQSIRGLRGPKPRGRGYHPCTPVWRRDLTPTNGGFRLPLRGGRIMEKVPDGGAKEREHRGRFSVSGAWPGRMGPARSQTPRQRFSTPAPRFGERASADRRRFPPACKNGLRSLPFLFRDRQTTPSAPAYVGTGGVLYGSNVNVQSCVKENERMAAVGRYRRELPPIIIRFSGM